MLITTLNQPANSLGTVIPLKSADPPGLINKPLGRENPMPSSPVIHRATAYTPPWHGVGRALGNSKSIDDWARAAGMDWTIAQSPVQFATAPSGDDAASTFDDYKVLYRSDNHTPLSVVGSRYQVVQPREVLEFYRDLSEVFGYELETAGVLKQGRKFWALARTGKQSVLKGNDVVKGYLLLATSCDGTLATTATPTTIRVTCSNSLHMALRDGSQAIKVPHRSVFDARAVKQQLGLAVSQWDSFMYRMKALSECKVKTHEAMHYFLKVLSLPDDTENAGKGLTNERALKRVQEIYQGHGRGAELNAAHGTAWGLLCAVTEFIDHERRARNAGNRLESAWFGQGAVVKQKALEHALVLAS